MALVRRTNQGELTPWSAWRDLETQFSRMFGEFTNDFGFGKQFQPAIDLRETEEAYHLEADIPGMKKEDIHLEVVEDTVTIRGERKMESEKKEKDFHRVERQYGSFVRSIEIPSGFDAEKVSAKFEDGVLKVTLPKREESKPKSIKVETN